MELAASSTIRTIRTIASIVLPAALMSCASVTSSPQATTGEVQHNISMNHSDGSLRGTLPVKDYDTPPLGAYVTTPPYPFLARKSCEEGIVRLSVRISASGNVKGISLLGTSGFPDLDKAATDTVWDWKFRPATKSGSPVAATIPLSIQFQLRDTTGKPYERCLKMKQQ